MKLPATKALLAAGVAQIGFRVAIADRWDKALALAIDTAILLLLMGLLADFTEWLKTRWRRRAAAE